MMAMALHSPTSDSPSSLNRASLTMLAPNLHDRFPRGLSITELDLKDTRYPSLATPTHAQSPLLPNPYAPARHITPDDPQHSTLDSQPQPDAQSKEGSSAPGISLAQESTRRASSDPTQEQQRPMSESPRSLYPQGVPLRAHAVEHYSLTDSFQLFPSSADSTDANTKPPADSKSQASQQPSTIASNPQRTQTSTQAPQRTTWQPPPRESQQSSLVPPIARHSYFSPGALGPATGAAAGQSATGFAASAMASPSYSTSKPIAIPVSPKLRAPAQQPTYITPASAPNPINPVFSPSPPNPMEEVCVECAMRDQDMADVDVTSPGIWERDSDAAYEELLHRELDEEEEGVAPENPNRPRARGGRLTEPNLKLWLSLVRPPCLPLTQTLNNFAGLIEPQGAGVEAADFGQISQVSANAA